MVIVIDGVERPVTGSVVAIIGKGKREVHVTVTAQRIFVEYLDGSKRYETKIDVPDVDGMDGALI